MSEDRDDSEPDFYGSRREFDRWHAERLREMSGSIDRLQEAFSQTLRDNAKIQAGQAAGLERLTALAEKLAEHEEREDGDRARILATLEGLAKALQQQSEAMKVHDEAIGTLKRWSIFLAMAIGSVSTAGVGWVISHLQTTMIMPK